MSDPHSFVILGADHWHAPWHLDALEGAGQRVAALSGAAPAAIRLGDRTGIPVFPDWPEVLERHPEATAVVLTRPDRTPPLLAALTERNRRFVLEKPGTIDAAALAPAVEAVSARGLATLVPFVNRDMAFWREVEALEGAGRDWTHAAFRIIAGPPDRYIRDDVAWVLDPKAYGGGALRNLGIHAADAVATLTDPERVEIIGIILSSRLHGLAVEDFAIALLKTHDGRTISIEAGYAMPTEKTADKEWRLHGPGWAVAEHDGMVSVRTGEGLRRRESAGSAAQYRAFGETMAGLARGEPGAHAAITDLLAAQRLVDRLYKAAGGLPALS